jgi:hypothetical protein
MRFITQKPVPRRAAMTLIAAAAFAVATLAAHSRALAGPGNGDQQWVATWATAQVSQAPSDANRINDQTLRQIVHVSVGGDQVRVKL